jgi:hypothetical protein
MAPPINAEEPSRRSSAWYRKAMAEHAMPKQEMPKQEMKVEKFVSRGGIRVYGRPIEIQYETRRGAAA